MNEQRTSRSTRDLSTTPIDRLQLPRPGSGRGRGSRSPSPTPQVGSNGPFPVSNCFTYPPSATASAPSSTSLEDAEDRFVDAPSGPSTSAAMAGLIEPPGENASMDEVKRYAETLRQQALAFSNSLATTTQLLSQALTNNTPRVSKRKPELPPFDQNHIEAWIRRTEAAFTRAEITAPKEKFAHLESVITVDLHPSINKYFSGPATQAEFDEFIKFLRERYGRTKQQKVKAAIEGVRRNGRNPEDLAALLDDHIGDVTIEDIKKSHFMAEMPQSVRNNLADKQDTLSFHELAKAAKAYFNQDGSLRASNNQVNSINPNGVTLPQTSIPTPSNPNASQASPNFTTAFEDHPAPHGDINAINRRGSSNNNNRQPSRSRNTSNRGRGSTNRSSSRPSTTRDASSQNPNWCWTHNKFGNEARNCKPPCSFANNNSSQSGNSRGGRR